ncbi:hypothetical protein KUTeg_012973 [Tegillarca granosa]|uniref:DUF5577 domain-containing protein n=1 Tax=Tegillarca granosa TaxID=220873 RepID=A0ABQ9ESR5_TEGGR|nr:hypothetical protein KUTeg_012973 [Tegillarca granosa]
MTAPATDTSYWIKFFTDCGIPAGEAANYAVTFTDNRIQKDHLNDLTKEYLNDMGIKILGDVIAILKHSKDVYTQISREKTLRGNSSINAKRTASPVPRRSTAASRIVDHYLGNDPDAAPLNQPVVNTPKISKELSARLGNSSDTESPANITKIVINNNKLKEEVPVPKKRRVFPEHEGKYKITMPSGTTAKTQKILKEQGLSKFSAKQSSTVFDRLGADTSAPRKTTLNDGGLIVVKSLTLQDSVFTRLGGKTTVKRAATSTSVDLDSSDEEGDPLEYAGVLKNAVAKKASVGVKTEGILSFKADAEPRSLHERLGKKVASPVVSSTSEIQISAKTVKSEVSSSTMVLRDTKITVATKADSGVFGRLGKQAAS